MEVLRFEPRKGQKPPTQLVANERIERQESDAARLIYLPETQFAVLLSARDRELLQRGIVVLSFERLRRMVR